MTPDQQTTRLLQLAHTATTLAAGEIQQLRTDLTQLRTAYLALHTEHQELQTRNRQLDTITNHLHQLWTWLESPTGPDPEYDWLSDQFQQLCETGTIPRRPTIHITVDHTQAAKKISQTH